MCCSSAIRTCSSFFLLSALQQSSCFPKKFLGAKKAVIPKTAQKTIPFQEAYENGLFLNYDGSYSLIFSFENIDYSLFRDEEKQEVYKKYTQLMNSIPTDIKLQEFLMNTDIDTDILREIDTTSMVGACPHPTPDGEQQSTLHND